MQEIKSYIESETFWNNLGTKQRSYNQTSHRFSSQQSDVKAYFSEPNVIWLIILI